MSAINWCMTRSLWVLARSCWLPISGPLQHASEFPLPLLLMHGTADAIAFPSGSKEFAAALGGKAKLVLWDNLYHETHNEPEKAEVFKTAIQWMDEHLQK